MEARYASAIVVPFQVPDDIVPKVVILVVPSQVLNAVFSTLFKLKSVFTSAILLPSIPVAVNLA